MKLMGLKVPKVVVRQNREIDETTTPQYQKAIHKYYIFGRRFTFSVINYNTF